MMPYHSDLGSMMRTMLMLLILFDYLPSPLHGSSGRIMMATIKATPIRSSVPQHFNNDNLPDDESWASLTADQFHQLMDEIEEEEGMGLEDDVDDIHVQEKEDEVRINEKHPGEEMLKIHGADGTQSYILVGY